MSYEHGFFANTAVTVYALSVYDDTSQLGSFMSITEAIAESMPGIRASDIQLLLHWVQVDKTVEYSGEEMPDMQKCWMKQCVSVLIQKIQADMQDSASIPPNRMVLLDAPTPVCAAIGTMLRDAGITHVITKHRHLLYHQCGYWKVHDILAADDCVDKPNKSVMISKQHSYVVSDELQASRKGCFLVDIDTSVALTCSSYDSDNLEYYTRVVGKRLGKPYCIVDYIKYGLKKYTDDASPKEIASVTREALDKVPEGCTLVMYMMGNAGWECVHAYTMGMQIKRADFFAQPIMYIMWYNNRVQSVILR